MAQFAKFLTTLLSVLIWTIALFVFLVAVPLLAKRDISAADALSGVFLYTLFSAALVYIGWRIFHSGRKMA